jgi:two-component system, OmpR family, alkaline phosphatase synthesis response regulator PhoP
VLIVDDERDIVRFMQIALEHEGVAVRTAYNGREALDILSRERFDILILDVMMPVMDGIELLRQVRLNPETENLFVIMLTAKVQDGDVLAGYHYGADIYLTKPVSLGELTTIIRSMLW